MSKSDKNGFDQNRLDHMCNVIQEDINKGDYCGANIIVARGGEIALQKHFGTSGPVKNRTIAQDSVYNLFSMTKAFTNALTLRAIEQGKFALTTRVVDIIPEFSGGEREKINFFHLLTHSSGLASVFSPIPGMYIDYFDEMFEAVCQNVHNVAPVGEKVTYSPLAHHVLMGEAIRRLDDKKRSLRDIYAEDLFTPLGMTSTALGVRKDLKGRHNPPDWLCHFPITHLGHSDLGPNGAYEEEKAEMPWVGAVSTADDIFKFAEMLRKGGALNGNRILSPAMLTQATKNWTGEKPNELYRELLISKNLDPSPAYIGLGFSMRGTAICHNQLGILNSPNAFGNYGSGSTLFWVDPVRDITFVCLTNGVIDEHKNVLRFQKLSDLAISSAI